MIIGGAPITKLNVQFRNINALAGAISPAHGSHQSIDHCASPRIAASTIASAAASSSGACADHEPVQRRPEDEVDCDLASTSARSSPRATPRVPDRLAHCAPGLHQVVAQFGLRRSGPIAPRRPAVRTPGRCRAVVELHHAAKAMLKSRTAEPVSGRRTRPDISDRNASTATAYLLRPPLVDGGLACPAAGGDLLGGHRPQPDLAHEVRAARRRRSWTARCEAGLVADRRRGSRSSVTVTVDLNASFSIGDELPSLQAFGVGGRLPISCGLPRCPA